MFLHLLNPNNLWLQNLKIGYKIEEIGYKILKLVTKMTKLVTKMEKLVTFRFSTI